MGMGRARSGQETGRRRRVEPEVSGGRGIVNIAPCLELFDAARLSDEVPIEVYFKTVRRSARRQPPLRFANDLVNM